MSAAAETGLTGVTVDQARAHVALLNLLLAAPGLDEETVRRASWLKMRLAEILPEADRPFDFIDAKIAWLLGAPARAVAA